MMKSQHDAKPNNGFLYITAARGIQDFILRGNKLKEMVGGSQIVDALTSKEGSLLFDLLAQIGLSPGDANSCRVLTAAAGGARLWIAEEGKARQLFRLWPLVAGRQAPGIEVVQVLIAAGENLAKSLSDAETERARQRNRTFPRLPLAGPLVARAPRTGEPAVERRRRREGEEWCDAQQVAKQAALQNSQNAFGLAHRVSALLDKPWDHEKWPFDFSEITNNAGERSYLALIHADGNSLGQTWMKIIAEAESSADNEGLFTIYERFSQAIEETSLYALAEGLRPILEKAENYKCKRYPVRPILCAGDDVTLVLRADFALEFARDYLATFEEKSAELLARLEEEQPVLGKKLPKRIHAGMGIAFVKERFPFAQAYELCESLCACVKKASRDHSGLAFHRVTTSATDSYSNLRDSELSSRDRKRVLTMNPYFMVRPEKPHHPLIQDLIKAVESSAKLPRGPLRETAAEAVLSVELAEKRMERLREVTRRREGASWDGFEGAMRELLGTGPNAIPLWRETEDVHVTPLNDILEIKALSRFEKKEDAEPLEIP